MSITEINPPEAPRVLQSAIGDGARLVVHHAAPMNRADLQITTIETSARFTMPAHLLPALCSALSLIVAELGELPAPPPPPPHSPPEPEEEP